MFTLKIVFSLKQFLAVKKCFMNRFAFFGNILQKNHTEKCVIPKVCVTHILYMKV